MTLIFVAGRVTPEFAALIAALFQVVILPVKILAINTGVRVSLSTPFRL